MANNKKEQPVIVALPVSPPPAPAKELVPAAKYDELPEVKSIGIAKVKGGWVVVELMTQGEKVLDYEVVCGPDPKGVAMEQLKLVVVRRILMNGLS